LLGQSQGFRLLFNKVVLSREFTHNVFIWFEKGKRWGRVPSFIKEHKSVNLSLKNFFIFIWKIVRTPLPVVDKDTQCFYLVTISVRYVAMGVFYFPQGKMVLSN
jgi:hypothetical protein